MGNAYQGEITLNLNGRDVPMKIDLDVIAQFQAETGVCFMHAAMKAINAYYKSRELDSPIERAEMLTGAISMEHAAHLFFLAAKKLNRVVVFGEMQEEVLMEGPIADLNGRQSYPFLFIQLVQFATFGVMDEVKKKSLSES